MDSETVLFGPDWNLAEYTKGFTNKTVVPIPSYGFCPVHKLFNKEQILELKKVHPDAEVMAHPRPSRLAGAGNEAHLGAGFVGCTGMACHRTFSRRFDPRPGSTALLPPRTL